MYDYETMIDAINDLKERGYTHDLSLTNDSLECKDLDLRLRAEDFDIDEFYRFEGESDPADNTIVYAVSSEKKNLKGTLVHAYGTYSEAIDPDLLAKLTPHTDVKS
ncbi:MAG: phosphoribosylpyrophosphate synthetase [Mucilaginibacter polytrichastri]|nr:phosphoribosylpyrophosphate synthetase [Mucilaginibacter polytrichastri]